MPQQFKKIGPPSGFSRLIFRLPIWLYHAGLGGMLGKRFVCLTHTGRKSGLPRQTILEVVRYDPGTGTCIVAAGFGDRSDWVQNVARNPHIVFTIGRLRKTGLAEKLTAETAGQELVAYSRLHPVAWRELSNFMGYRLDGTVADTIELGKWIPMFKLIPE